MMKKILIVLLAGALAASAVACATTPTNEKFFRCGHFWRDLRCSGNKKQFPWNG